MDFVQLSILRAGGVFVDERAIGDWERLRRNPAPRRSGSRAQQKRPNWLLQSLGAFFVGLSGGLAGLGRGLQERAARSASESAMNGCGATPGIAR